MKVWEKINNRNNVMISIDVMVATNDFWKQLAFKISNLERGDFFDFCLQMFRDGKGQCSEEMLDAFLTFADDLPGVQEGSRYAPNLFIIKRDYELN